MADNPCHAVLRHSKEKWIDVRCAACPEIEGTIGLCLTAVNTSLQDRIYQAHEQELKAGRMAGWFACTGPHGKVPAARLSRARRNMQFKLYLRNAALRHLPLGEPVKVCFIFRDGLSEESKRAATWNLVRSGP
eukprot:g56949.t1